jgi:hypothetical protein
LGSKENKEKIFPYNPGESYSVIDAETGAIIRQSHFFDVKIQKILKGNYNSKTITIGEPAALVQQTPESQYIITEEEYAPVKKNKKYIFYILDTTTLETKYPEIFKKAGYPNRKLGRYSIISVRFGKYNLDSTDVDEAKQVNNDPILKDFKEKISGKYKKDYDATVD